MRYFWIFILALLTAACARTEFAATPNPEEISTITYQKNSPYHSEVWYFVNNDLRLHYSKRNRGGKMISRWVRKITPNDFNWLVTEIEKTNYLKLKSSSKFKSSSLVGGQMRPSGAMETFTIENLGGIHAFQKTGNTRLPHGLAQIAQKIPVIFR